MTDKAPELIDDLRRFAQADYSLRADEAALRCLAGACGTAADELAAATAVIAKLPKYTDTGERFVPGVNEAWANVPHGPKRITGAWKKNCKGWWFSIHRHDLSVCADVLNAYSTQAAAEAAGSKSDDD